MKKNITKKIETKSKEMQAWLIFTLMVVVVGVGGTIKSMIDGVGGDVVLATQIGQIVSYCVFLMILIVAIKTFRLIAKNGTPFFSKVAKNIKIMGWLLVALSFTLPVIGLILSVMDNNFVDFSNNMPVLSNFTVGMVLVCFGLVFDYGCALQKRDDETL